MVDSLAAQSSICTSCSSFPVYQLACTKVARSSLCLFSAAFAGAERHKRRVMIPYGLFSIYFEPYACFKDLSDTETFLADHPTHDASRHGSPQQSADKSPSSRTRTSSARKGDHTDPANQLHLCLRTCQSRFSSVAKSWKVGLRSSH